MRVHFLRGTALGGELNAYPGQVLDLPDAQAEALVASGRARTAPADPTDAIEAPADAGVSSPSDAAPKRRARKTTKD